MVGSFFVEKAGNLDYAPGVLNGTGISYVAEIQGDLSVLFGIELDFLNLRKKLLTGVTYYDGDIIMNTTAKIKTVNAGAGADGYILDINGIRGYSAALGKTFDLPTNGSAPEFSSGIIKYTTFEINTNAVLRTAATVGDGGASSAGVLINSTGLYGCKASQLLANANVKILADGTFAFNGDANNSISWNGTTLAVKGAITLTNTISADSVTDGTTNKAYTGTEKTKLSGIASGADVTLSAINGELSLTGGGLVLASGGAKIRSGQTAYNTGTGFWLGDVTGTPKFSMGVSTGNYLTWDGTSLTVKGSITLTNTISADSVTDGTTNKAYTGTEKTKLSGIASGADVTLSAINGGLTVTGGGITLSAAGKFCGGKSTFADSNVGFFLGYESSAYKFKIYNSASKYFEYDGTDFVLAGGTITGGTIQTKVDPGSGDRTRVLISGAENKLYFYDYSNNAASLWGSNGRIYSGQAFESEIGFKTPDPAFEGYGISISSSQFTINKGYASPTTGFYPFISINSTGLFIGGDYTAGNEKFKINASGQITKVDNIAAAAKRVLIGDTTGAVLNFTPRLLAYSDLPALTANRVLLSDASGYVSASSVTNTTLGYLDATSSIQTQINGKAAASWGNTGSAAYYATVPGNPITQINITTRDITINGTQYTFLTSITTY